MGPIGVIQEQGDLGLGFDLISNAKEQQQVQQEIAQEHAEIKSETEGKE